MISTEAQAVAPAAEPLFRDGWYRFAAPLPSPNCGPRPAGVDIDLIVLHCISLPPGEYGGGQVQLLFTNQLDWQAHPYFQTIRGLEVSAHFYIERTGRLWQFVSCAQRAWHAGVSRMGDRSNCNDFSIGIELEGLDGEPFDAPQYASLRALTAALMAHYPIAHVVGHEHIAPGRKRDPGAGFNWLRLRDELALASHIMPASVLESPRT